MKRKTLLHEDYEYFALVETWDEKHKVWQYKCFKYFPFVQYKAATEWCKGFIDEQNPQQRTTLELVKKAS